MKPCPSCGGDCGYTKKKGCQYQSGKKEWIGLTAQERDEINEQVYGAVPHHVAFYHAIEAKLKEKNYDFPN